MQHPLVFLVPPFDPTQVFRPSATAAAEEDEAEEQQRGRLQEEGGEQEVEEEEEGPAVAEGKAGCDPDEDLEAWLATATSDRCGEDCRRACRVQTQR